MKRILMIGCGNPYRGDDGIGFRTAEQFERLNQDHATVRVMAVQELKPELVEDVSRADSVIFVTAATSGEPGSVWLQEVFPERGCDGLLNQHLTPCTLMAASKVIYRRCPDAYLITVAGEDFEFSSHLSPRVEAARQAVIAHIEEIINGAKYREAYIGSLQPAVAEDW